MVHTLLCVIKLLEQVLSVVISYGNFLSEDFDVFFSVGREVIFIDNIGSVRSEKSLVEFLMKRAQRFFDEDFAVLFVNLNIVLDAFDEMYVFKVQF